MVDTVYIYIYNGSQNVDITTETYIVSSEI
jgi:hypothetical protein